MPKKDSVKINRDELIDTFADEHVIEALTKRLMEFAKIHEGECSKSNKQKGDYRI